MTYFILDRTPNAIDTVKWTDICHSSEAFVFIRHEPRRDTSRWCSVERQRPFMVASYSKARSGSVWHEISAHKTLEAAIAAAAKLTK